MKVETDLWSKLSDKINADSINGAWLFLFLIFLSYT